MRFDLPLANLVRRLPRKQKSQPLAPVSTAAAVCIESLEERRLLDAVSSIQFQSFNVVANEDGLFALLVVQRTGEDTSFATAIPFSTVDGSAKAGIDYVATTGTLTFPGTTDPNDPGNFQNIVVPIIDD